MRMTILTNSLNYLVNLALSIDAVKKAFSTEEYLRADEFHLAYERIFGE